MLNKPLEDVVHLTLLSAWHLSQYPVSENVTPLAAWFWEFVKISILYLVKKIVSSKLLETTKNFSPAKDTSSPGVNDSEFCLVIKVRDKHFLGTW